MDTSQPPKKNGKEKADAMLRRMGMSLSVLGIIVFSAGLVACSQSSGRVPDARAGLILASSMTMLAAGLYLWRSAKKTD